MSQYARAYIAAMVCTVGILTTTCISMSRCGCDSIGSLALGQCCFVLESLGILWFWGWIGGQFKLWALLGGTQQTSCLATITACAVVGCVYLYAVWPSFSWILLASCPGGLESSVLLRPAGQAFLTRFHQHHWLLLLAGFMAALRVCMYFGF